MALDDAHTSHNHGFELPEAAQVVVRNDSRPWRAVAGVALCLGLAGIVTGLIVARRQSANDEQVMSEALQREELRDGWKALGAAAAQEAHANDVQASPAASPAPAVPNVVIVNVPAQSAAIAPPNVTNINVPSGSYTGPNGAPTDSHISSLDAPTQSMPGLDFTPVRGYLPTQAGYTAPLASQPSFLPQNSYGTTSGGSMPVTPAVGNGSIPGSTSNSALPNTGLVGAPALPNGSAISDVTPSVP
jgi:hypothetical protein